MSITVVFLICYAVGWVVAGLFAVLCDAGCLPPVREDDDSYDY